MSKNIQTLEYNVDQTHDGLRLDKFLTAVMTSQTASRRKIRTHIDQGSVYVDKKRVHIASRTLAEGQNIQILWGSDKLDSHSYQMPWNDVKDTKKVFIFENEDFVVINKPRGLPCQPTKSNSRNHVGAWLKRIYGKELYLVHRIDQWTSGALVVAKNKKAMHLGMSEFKSRKVNKTYHCVSVGKPKQSLGVKPGTWKELQHNLLKPDQSTITVRIVAWRDKRGREATLKVRELGQSRTASNIPLCFLEVRPETGRTHQIRVQLAAEDLPLLGDNKYGSMNSSSVEIGPEGTKIEKGQYLHARKISIPSLRIQATADYPETWSPILDSFH